MSNFCAKAKIIPKFRLGLDSENLTYQGIRAIKFFVRLERQCPDEIWKGVKHFVYNIREITIENPVNPYHI